MIVVQISRTGCPETLSVATPTARRIKKPAANHDTSGPVVSIRIKRAVLRIYLARRCWVVSTCSAAWASGLSLSPKSFSVDNSTKNNINESIVHIAWVAGVTTYLPPSPGSGMTTKSNSSTARNTHAIVHRTIGCSSFPTLGSESALT